MLGSGTHRGVGDEQEKGSLRVTEGGHNRVPLKPPSNLRQTPFAMKAVDL